MTNLSNTLRDDLARDWSILQSRVVSKQRSGDGTVKQLLCWPDGETTECVLIPDDNRLTACISTQVGCPVGCVFCASGLNGLRRQLTPGEIVEQIVRINEMLRGDAAQAGGTVGRKPAAGSGRSDVRRVSNVVFMGLGEPLANYDAVMQAIRILNADWGLRIGARKITVSTVGLPKQIKRLADEDLQIKLAISLHAPNDRLRQELIPWAKGVSIEQLVDAARYYFDKTTREVTLEYIMLGGVNDRLEHAHELTRVCRQMRCNVNLIRYNPVEGLPYNRPISTDTHFFVKELRDRGTNVHVRKSRGIDIDAACGQLRRKHESGESMPVQISVSRESKSHPDSTPRPEPCPKKPGVQTRSPAAPKPPSRKRSKQRIF